MDGRAEPATVLLPTSRNPLWARRTVDALLEIEAGAEIEVVAMHLFHPDDDPLQTDGGGDAEDATLDEVAAEQPGVEAVLTRADDAASDRDLSVRTRGVRAAEPTTAILDAVEAYDAERIYLYGRKRSPTGKAIFGSRLVEILGLSPVPVVVIPPTER